MRTTLASFLLFLAGTCSAQSTIHDVSAPGNSFELSGTTAAVNGRNVSQKDIMFFTVVLRTPQGQTGATFNHDYYFKINGHGIQPGESVTLNHMLSHRRALDESLTEGTVAYIQFADGTSWGDPGIADAGTLIANRPRLVELYEQALKAYNSGGENGVQAFLEAAKADAAQSETNRVEANHLLAVMQQKGVAESVSRLQTRLAAAAQHSQTPPRP
jgi:hypothetical protein